MNCYLIIGTYKIKFDKVFDFFQLIKKLAN